MRAGLTAALAATLIAAGCGGQHHAATRHHRGHPEDPQVRAYREGYTCGSDIPGLVAQFPHVPFLSWVNACVKGARKDRIKAMAWDRWGIRDGVYDAVGKPKKTVRYHCLFQGACGEDKALDLYWEHLLGG